MILNAKIVRDFEIDSLKNKINSFDKKLKLVVIRVGNDKASEIYVNFKRKLCNEVNIDFEEIHLSENINECNIINIIEKLNNDINVTSILIQLPLPNHLNSNNIINKINPYKDVDGLTDVNIGMMFNKRDCIIPCTTMGIETLLDYYNIDISGKNAVLIGRSNLVGIPLINMILKRNATLTVCHTKTKNLSNFTKNADIIFIAAGHANLVVKDMVKKDAIIIDIGINRIDGKICGDADFENLKDYVKAITPVPGGIGVMTVLSVIKNVIKCYELQNK